MVAPARDPGRHGVERGEREHTTDEASRADWATSKSRADPAFETSSTERHKEKGALTKTHRAAHSWHELDFCDTVAAKLLIGVSVSSPVTRNGETAGASAALSGVLHSFIWPRAFSVSR
jgi:hypothetical protein